MNPIKGMTHATMHVSINASVEIDIEELAKELGRQPTESDLKEAAVNKELSELNLFESSAKVFQLVNNNKPVKKGIGSY